MAASPADTSATHLATAPDGWAPEPQVAHMLGLCEAQMDSALQESDGAVDALIQAFTQLVDTARSVGAMTQALPAEMKAHVSEDFDGQLATLSRQIASAVVAFQFYDKLTQRLGHVRYSLSALALFVCNRAQMQQPEQWQRLQATLRRLYRTEEERQVFQMIMDGKIDSFIDTAPAGDAAAGEVELF
jgi:hypothetical protein